MVYPSLMLGIHIMPQGRGFSASTTDSRITSGFLKISVALRIQYTWLKSFVQRGFHAFSHSTFIRQRIQYAVNLPEEDKLTIMDSRKHRRAYRIAAKSFYVPQSTLEIGVIKARAR
ncbi:hypothetical protein AVEN_168684-1 [Araneus ventricosus]|uniref:Uncharacterized protein n=1 Tax=Araneus ventricosus TaxID=182803 RepID=A0A4Y2M2L2_ARAVE|nr:hypothetical protein AVEN_168684-1 [Araneus ventricosus]